MDFQKRPILHVARTRPAALLSFALIGWLLLEGAVLLESAARGVDRGDAFAAYVPLFSVVLPVGMGVQFLRQALGWDPLLLSGRSRVGVVLGGHPDHSVARSGRCEDPVAD